MRDQKILLVEDDADEEELALIALAKSGAPRNEIDVVRDGQEALDYLLAEGDYANRNIRDIPRVVFLDINLPKLSGLEVLKRIRENETTSIVPIVILTSSDEQQDMLEGYRNGANSYIRKAYDFDEFIANIGALRNYWLTLNMIPND